MNRNDAALQAMTQRLALAMAEEGFAIGSSPEPPYDEAYRIVVRLGLAGSTPAIDPDTVRNVRDALRFAVQTPIVAAAVDLLTALIEPPAVRPPSEPAGLGRAPASTSRFLANGSPVPVAPPRPETGVAVPAVSSPGVDN